MFMKNFLLLIGFFLLGTSVLDAQAIYRFSKRTDKFPYELREFMTMRIDKSQKKAILEYIDQFEVFWLSDTLSEKQKLKVVAISNILAQKRIRAYPDFQNYLDAVWKTAHNKKGLEIFNDWLGVVGEMAGGRSRTNFNRFLKISTDLFRENILNRSQAFVWKVNKLNFKFAKEGKYPVFLFDTVTVSCVTKADSTKIFRTRGVYNPLRTLWNGEDGRVYWTRVGFDASKVYADLTKYEIKLKSNRFVCDTVNFYDKRQFDFPLLGRLSEKIMTSRSTRLNYPSFTSFRTDLMIKNVFKDVDYQGGYTLKGANIIGSGTKENKAYFIFKRNGKPFVWAGAESFSFNKDHIRAPHVRVILYIEQDSIYHPGLQMDYNNTKRQLALYREEEGLSKAPFYDSYHKLDLFVEAFFWKLDDDFIDMKSVVQRGTVSEARFESLNLFTEARYSKLQGIDRVNPVKAVFDYVNSTGTDGFYAEEFGRYIGMGPTVTIRMLMDLASKGFLIYDVQDNYVIVKDRVRIYIEAHKGKIDYDVIGFRSSVVGIPNASLNLRNSDLVIQGVRSVFLSDSQDVYIYPAHKQVVVKKNRDFSFDGIIRAGKFDLAIRQGYFSYDKFELDLPIIDSLSFRVTSFEPDEYGEYHSVRVKNTIRDLKGNILIDRPDNKSGRKAFAEYPIMNNKSYAYVYYDKKSIYNGVYKRDKFYYRLDPFTIDSLDNFKTDGISFSGYLTSAGIFNDIEQPLKVQPDYSLGFVYHTGPSGKSIYNNKGRFVAEISLSNKGLEGNGVINYLTSTAYSDNFKFFPDSTNAYLSSYEIEEQEKGVQFPMVMGDSLYMHWTPYSDLMEVSTLDVEKPMAMYSSESHMLGTLSLRPKGLEGNGIIYIKEAEMVSDHYRFKYSEFDADTTDFRLKKFVDTDEEDLESENDYAYETENFKTHVDFVERKADFEANGSAQKVDFPENMYLCYMDKFTWFMDRDETEFSSKKETSEEFKNASMREKIDLDLAGSKFVSTHPDQDSLHFFAQKAVFSRRKTLITAQQVEFILVGDAAIYPDSGRVVIHKKADMEELTDAGMIVNTTTKYFKLHDGTFKILGRKKYHGRALYDYKDEDGNLQNIYFTKLEVDTTGTTHGEGKIEESAEFTLSKYFDFIGDVYLIANKEFLRFSGGTRIAHQCDTMERQALFFDAFIDPVNIKIPVPEQPHTPENGDLFAGMFESGNGIRVYPAFLQAKRRASDLKMFSADGFLIYNKTMQEYIISTEDRLNRTNKTDNYLSLSKRTCEVRASGEMQLAFNAGWVKASVYGDLVHYKRKDSTGMHVAIPFDFFFNEKALELMANDLNSRMELDPVNLQSDVMRLMLGKLEGEEKAEKLYSEISLYGGAFKKVPESLQKSLVIADVEMKWNPRTKSFVSTGKIGIGNMGKVQILKYVDGVIEIKNKASSVKITIALDLGGKEYYYFVYNSANGLMSAYSSNKDFVTLIKETKPDDRKLKNTGKGKKYSYYLSTPTSYKAFMRKMKMYR